MVHVKINDIELQRFLIEFGNKTEVVCKALHEYKQRHYEGVYFSVEEVEEDLIKYEKQLKEANEILPKLKQKLKELKEENDLNSEKQ